MKTASRILAALAALLLLPSCQDLFRQGRTGTLVISLIENGRFPLEDIFFEASSAMGTVGVSMAALITVVWLGMLLVTALMQKKALKAIPATE